MASILEDSKKAKRRGILGVLQNKRILISGIIIIVIPTIAFFLINWDKTGDTEVQKKEWTVKQDNIRMAIETDGKVVAEDGVKLSFSVSGNNLEIEEVFIKEGDKIKKGDKIATVKTETLELNVRAVYSSYLSALASYSQTIDGATEEEIADAKDSITSSEISLEQAQIALENIKQSAKKSIYDAEQDLKDAKEELDDNQDELTSEDVSDAYEALVDTIKSISISLSSILRESDEIIGVDEESINNDFENLLGVKDTPTLTQAKTSYLKSKNELAEYDSLVILLSLSSAFEEIDAAAELAVLTLQEFEKHLYSMKAMLEATITSSNFSQTSLDAFIATISTNRAAVNTKITAMNTKIEAVDDVKDALDDHIDAYTEAQIDLDNEKSDTTRDIENANANVRSKELSLEQVKRDYDDLLAPLTEKELASARSSLTSASVNLKKVQNELENATIISPIDGEVARLNYKTGDIIVDNSASDPVAVISNNDTLFIEVNIEEADINKIKVGQKALAAFDALGDLEMEGEISFISLTSETSNNGIVTYLVRVLFENTNEAQVREGMTAFVDFIIAGVSDVLVIPVEAVRNIGGKPSIELASGQWTAVITGFTDGKNVEIINGVSAGDRIIY